MNPLKPLSVIVRSDQLSMTRRCEFIQTRATAFSPRFLKRMGQGQEMEEEDGQKEVENEIR